VYKRLFYGVDEMFKPLYFCHFSLLMYLFLLVWDLEEVGRRTQQ